MKQLFSILILIVSNVIVFRAQPGNDDCTSPISLCANQAQSGSTQDATISVCIGCSDGATAAGNFCFTLENTVWFSFTTNSTGGDAQIDFSNMVFDLTAGFGSSLEAVVIEANVASSQATSYNVCVATTHG